MKAQRRFGPFAALLLLTTVVGMFALNASAQRPDRVTLPGHVISVLSEGALTLPVAKSDGAEAARMQLTIVLRRGDEIGLQQLADRLNDPQSHEFRRWLTPEQIADRFGPSTEDFQTVEAFFQAEGFEVVERSSNRMTLTVSAPRNTIERSLQVTIADYKIFEPGKDRTFHANREDPSLPATIATRIHSIAGLSTLGKPRPVIIEAINRLFCGGEADAAGYNKENLSQPGRAACEKVADDCLAQGRLKQAASVTKIKTDICSKFKAGGTPDPFPRAADPPVDWKDADGTGQKVGITAFDTFQTSDVADFLDLFGAPASVLGKLSRVAVNGGAVAGPDQSEVLLDITTILTGAPGAQIIVYDAPFGAGAFQAMFNRMIADGVSIISNSWAYCENQTSAADVQGIDSILAAAAASGITVFSAVGDTGSTCLNGSANTISVPAGSPRVTAVGGTTAVPGPDATWRSESWWNGAGGFGVSRFFPRPAYQNGISQAPLRSVPDLAFSSDPNYGVIICQAAAGGCPAPFMFGGTSFAAPALAAATAVMNHAAGTRLGHLNPQIYPLAGTTAFHTPAELASDFAHVGLGSPILNTLFLRLTGAIAGAVSASQSLVKVVSDRVAANGTANTRVVVYLRDVKGNMIIGKTVSLTQSAGGTAVITPPSMVTTAANGAAIFEVRSTTVQNVTFTATDVTDGVVLTQTGVVNFDVPPATAGGINAFPTSVLNNGTATTTITVTLQDAQGNPTPGKLVTLSQGAGHSIITGPSPSVTDANGQIQFTATNRYAETVVYTAVDVTDGDLPVPGSGTVNFTGTATSSCVPATPNAALGFALTPFATGFLAEAFNFSNVNFGCAGATNPGFDAGGVLIGNFRTGELFRLPAGGGAATTTNVISSPGQTIGSPVFGKNGKLYATRAATGGNFTTGNILELDPVTGATSRVIASNLTCPGGLSVDPISGDLFFTGTCFGAGSNDPILHRVVNPGSTNPPPTVVNYVTLAASPNGAIAFAPDGTIYVATDYLSANPPIVRVSGTNQPQPPTVTPVPGVVTNFWVTMGETLPNGSAKSLVFLGKDDKLKLADITTNPPTITELILGPTSSGVIGADGCLYTSDGATVFKLTSASGNCGFTPTSPAPGIVLSPAFTTPDPMQGTQRTVTARLVSVPNPAGMPIIFRVNGANARFQMVRADANGEALFTYRGGVAGTDTITADLTLGTEELLSNQARLNWTAGPHLAFVSLNLSPTNAVVGQPITLTGTLIDAVADPRVPIPSVTLQFNVAGQTCNAVTNASGVASCAVTVPLTGNYTLSVTFAGNGAFVASTDSERFSVLPPGAAPCSAFDDVDLASPFCASVEWIKNRGVTVGCQATLYCPFDSVVRLQMAAFMKRLGSALSGTVLRAELQSGAIDLDAQPVVCQTGDFATGNYARRVIVDASFSGLAANPVGFAADAVASLDAGATWTPLAAVGNRSFAASGHWGHARARGIADVDPNQSVRFGLWVSRGALSGTADLVDSTCKLRAVVGNR